MNKKLKPRLEAVRTALHENVKDLDPSEYRELLDELETDVRARLSALDEEQGDEG